MPAAAWSGRLQEMRQVLEQHIAEEERAVLPQVEMKYDLEKLRDLGDELARREMEVKQAHGAREPRRDVKDRQENKG